MKISIVTAYYNRKKAFTRTLESISRSSHSDIEVIAVDDASDEAERIEDLEDIYSFLKVIRINKENKTWVNPCIPYNMGFLEASGEAIIIQNPECLHLGDIISTTASQIEEGKYLVFDCYSIDRDNTNVLDVCYNDDDIRALLYPLYNSYRGDGQNGWYTHAEYRPHMLHFCSAISNKDLQKIGGFDERFSQGVAYDDNEFLERIIRSDIEIQPLSFGALAIHQYHPPMNYQIDPSLSNINKLLFDKMKGENEIHPPENKIYPPIPHF